MRLSAWPFLLLLILIPLLHRWWISRNRPARVTYSVPIPASIAVRSPVKILLALQYLGWGLLVLSLARPQTSFTQLERSVSGIDIMMVLDVSASMAIEDLNDRPRIDVAKETMDHFVQGRSNDRIGFVMFSGEPLTLAPPTLDYGLVLKQLRDVELNVLKDGTAIGDGLALSVNHLRNSKARSRVVILLTDGENNVGQVDPMTAGELAAGYGIRVYTIAIGREGRVKLPIRQKGLFGKTITTYQWMDNQLNTELLQKISDLTKAKFFRVSDETTLNQVFGEIDQMEKTQIKSTEHVRYDEIFQKPLKLGIVVLLIEQVLARGWWRILP